MPNPGVSCTAVIAKAQAAAGKVAVRREANPAPSIYSIAGQTGAATAVANIFGLSRISSLILAMARQVVGA